MSKNDCITEISAAEPHLESTAAEPPAVNVAAVKKSENFDRRLNPHAPEFVPRTLSIDRSFATKVLNEGEETSYGPVYDAIWQERANRNAPPTTADFMRTTVQQRSSALLRQHRLSASMGTLMRGSSGQPLNVNAPEYVPQFRREQSLQALETLAMTGVPPPPPPLPTINELADEQSQQQVPASQQAASAGGDEGSRPVRLLPTCRTNRKWFKFDGDDDHDGDECCCCCCTIV